VTSDPDGGQQAVADVATSVTGATTAWARLVTGGVDGAGHAGTA